MQSGSLPLSFSKVFEYENARGQALELGFLFKFEPCLLHKLIQLQLGINYEKRKNSEFKQKTLSIC